MSAAEPDLGALVQEFVERARRGESPSIEEYVAAHPSLEHDIRELFPVLAVVEGLKRTGRVGSHPTGPILPERVGRYRVGREIGRGGMGIVHEAVAEGDDGRVALKVVHPHLLDRVEFVARFLREVEAGRRVAHPHLVRTLDLGLVDLDGREAPYLVLELVEGQNLRDLLAEVEVVPERLCRHVGACLAGALAAVHAAGLVHRDVKPENVVITANETVKLMDLGVAVGTGVEGHLTQTGEFVGSVLYAAPEQLRGAAPRPAWDLYALGVLLFELATGRHPDLVDREPGGGGTGRSVPTTPPSRVVPELSPFYDAVVAALLCAEGDRGFTDAAEVRIVLDEGEASAWWIDRELGAPRARAPAELQRPTPFHGRRSEWAGLDELLDDVLRGVGRTLLLVGDAGIGKTRLIREWLASLRKTTAPRCLYVRHRPGLGDDTLRDLDRGLLGLLGEGDPAVRLREILATRAPLAGPLLQRLRGEAPDAVEPHALDAGTARLMSELAAERPLVVVFEDLHFATPAEQERVVRLVRALRAAPVLVVASTRPVPAPVWAVGLEQLGHVRRMELGGLDPAACRALIRDAAGTGFEVPEQVHAWALRSDRNPMLLLSLVRDAERRNAREETAVASDTDIPPSLHALLASRLLSLDSEDRELLEAGACCGFGFDPLLVAEAAEVGRVAALKRFGRMHRRHGLLRPAGRRYEFQSHLLQEVVYGDIHTAMREAYHHALASRLEAQGARGARVGAHALALSHHHLEGERPARARPHLRLALEHLENERHDSRGAEALAERALREPACLDAAGRAMALWLRGRRRLLGGRTREAGEPLEVALRLCRETGDRKLEFQALRSRGHLHRAAGDYEAMERSYRAAAEVAASTDDPASAAMALGSLALEQIYRNHLDDAEETIRQGFAALEGRDDPFRAGRLLTYQARIRLRRGRLDEAARLFERAEAIAHGIGDLPTEAVNADGLGQLAFVQGRYADAVRHGRRSLEIKQDTGMSRMPVDSLANIALCLTQLGRFDEALDTAEEAVRIADLGQDRNKVSHAHMRRGAVRLARGELASALDDLELVRARLDEEKRPGFRAASAAQCADCYRLLGRHEAAEQVLDEAEGAEPPGRSATGLDRARARLLEADARWEKVREIVQRARGRAGQGTATHRALSLPLARALLHLEDADTARPLLEEARSWGRHSGALRYEVLAEVHLAALDAQDLLAARVALEQAAARLPAADRIEAHAALWRAGGDLADLRRAWAELSALVAAAPEADREPMLDRLALHREVAEAARVALPPR